MQKNDSKSLIFLIFFIALGLRYIGISHSLPFVFHPDEPTVVQSALGIRFFANPGHFDWPHLIIYLNYFVFMGFAYLRDLMQLDFMSAILPYLPKIIFDEPSIFYLLSRMFSAFLGALTVVPLYLAGREVFSSRVGVLAAIALAFTPFHVWHSHYSLIDVPMMFFVALGVYFCLKIIKRKDLNDYAGAGFYIGLAASAKYNGGLAALGVLFAHVIRIITNKEKFQESNNILYLVISGVTAIAGFLLGTPYALLDFKTFSRTDGPKGAFWQFKNVGSLGVGERLPSFLNDIAFKISDDLGYSIIIGFGLLTVLLIYRQLTKKISNDDKYLWFLVFLSLFLLVYISGFSKSRSHYFFIAYPSLILSFAYIVDWAVDKITSKSFLFGNIVLGIAFVPLILFSFKNSYTFFNGDTRTALYDWLKTNTRPTDLLVYDTSNVVLVMDKVPNKKIKIDYPPRDYVFGYFISTDDSMNLAKLNQQSAITKYRYELVHRVDNDFRLGPNIKVYTFRR